MSFLSRDYREGLLKRALKGRSLVNDHLGQYSKKIKDLKRLLKIYTASCEKEKITDVQIDLADMALRVENDYDKALKKVEDALLKIDDSQVSLQAQALNIKGVILWKNEDYEGAINILKETLLFYETLDDVAGTGSILNNLGTIHMEKGDLTSAEKYLKRALKIFSDLGDIKREAITSMTLGNIWELKGNYKTAMKYYQSAYRSARNINFQRALALGANNLGNIYLSFAQYDTALKFFDEYYNISKDMKSKKGIGIAANNMGIIYQYRGEWKKSLVSYREFLKITLDLKYSAGSAGAYHNLATVYNDMGDPAKALSMLKKAEFYTDKKSDQFNFIDILTAYSTSYYLIGEYNKAILKADKALKLSEKLGRVENKMYILRALGLAKSMKDPDKGLENLNEALKIALNSKLPYEEGMIRLDIGGMLLKKDRQKALEEIEKAKIIFQDLGIRFRVKEAMKYNASKMK